MGEKKDLAKGVYKTLPLGCRLWPRKQRFDLHFSKHCLVENIQRKIQEKRSAIFISEESLINAFSCFRDSNHKVLIKSSKDWQWSTILKLKLLFTSPPCITSKQLWFLYILQNSYKKEKQINWNFLLPMRVTFKLKIQNTEEVMIIHEGTRMV